MEKHADIEAFYRAHPEARRSPESDYGVWWKDDDGGNWRVSYVHDTGHVYAIGQGGTRSRAFRLGDELVVVQQAGDPTSSGPVLVLGRLEPVDEGSRYGWEPPAPAEEALEGWVERCGQQGSLAWARQQVQAAEGRAPKAGGER